MRADSSIHWTAYPALLVAFLFGLGVVLDHADPLPIQSASRLGASSLWMGSVVLATACLAGAWAWGRLRLVTLAPLLRVAGLTLLVVAAGGLRSAHYRTPAPGSVASLARTAGASGVDVTLTGVVADAPQGTDGTTRFSLDVTRVQTDHGTSEAEGRVRTTLRVSPWSETEATFPPIQAGDRLQVRTTLREAPGPRNPGAFDYGAYLRRRGVCCTAWVDAPADVRVVQDARGWLPQTVGSMRRVVGNQIDAHLPPGATRGVVRALLLGDRSAISDRRETHFVDTGLMHLLAVSGLHVLLVGMVLYGLLRPALMRLRLRWTTIEIARAVLTIGVLGFYMLLTGGRPSVVRAVIMATLLIGGIVLQRSSHALNTLGVAALILLALRPPALFDAGFQLSMSAVAGIVALHPRFVERLPERWTETEAREWLVSTVSVSLAATVATAPVLLHHFGQAALGGLVLNVLAIPLTTLGLSASIATVGAGVVWPSAGAAFGAATHVLLQGLLETASVGAAWLGWAQIRAAHPGPWLLAAATMGVVACAQWPRPRTRWPCVAVAVALLCVATWFPTGGRAATSDPVLDVVFLDVGQGDAAVLRTPNGSTVLVDAGRRTRYADAGRSVVLPFLASHGIDRLDAVVITHPDGDHLGGLPSILRAVPVDRVLHSGRASDTDLYRESRRLLDSLAVPHEAVHAGDVLRVDPSVRMQVVGPPTDSESHGLRSENDASVVLHVAFGSTEVLLTGDVERAGERWLVDAYGSQLAGDVVKVAHHGSSTSSTEGFVRAATALPGAMPGAQTGTGTADAPTHAVISVGRHNAYGLPDEVVLSRWQRRKVSIHQTTEGAVWMRTDGTAVWEIFWQTL